MKVWKYENYLLCCVELAEKIKVYYENYTPRHKTLTLTCHSNWDENLHTERISLYGFYVWILNIQNDKHNFQWFCCFFVGLFLGRDTTFSRHLEIKKYKKRAKTFTDMLPSNTDFSHLHKIIWLSFLVLNSRIENEK